MTKKRDEEFWVTKVFDLLKNNLNTKITAINAEKSDSLVLKTVDSSAYYYMTFGDQIPNNIPCVVFAVSAEPNIMQGNFTSETVRVMIEMVVSDEMIDDAVSIYRLLARYRRAIKDAVSVDFGDFQKFSIVSLPDVPFMAGNLVYHTIGIGVTFNYA